MAMQSSLEKLIASGGSAEMLVKAAVDLAAKKIDCIEYSKLNEQTAQIEDALNMDMVAFLSRAVMHIYVTPDRVRVKFINGKTVKSERSTDHE